ncbi:transcription factor bHLH90 isoform X2 [Amaranthus tricolor]|nr:transcription factor bHLH90 isoform X2 [Amaranthus tricolor]
MGCCCNGSKKQENGLKKVKKQKAGSSNQVCRDDSFVHLANTKSCEALAKFPPFLSVFSGLHGEVVISCQPHWLSADSKESCGTHVLIPVFGGLVELYSSKLLERNESIIEYVEALFNIKSELETMSTSTLTFDGQSINSYVDKSISCISSLNQANIPTWPQPLIPLALHSSETNLDGSSTGSFPLDERPSPDSNPCSAAHQKSLKLLTANHENSIIPVDRIDNRRKPEKGQCKSKNLITERNRRQRINDGILALRALVPKITKMHKAATLADAIDYIVELNNEIKELKGELKSSSVEDSYRKNTSTLKVSGLDKKVREPNQANTSLAEGPKLEVLVQTNKLSTGNFLLRIVCQQRHGVFTKLLQALDYLDLPVEDVNLTTCHGKLSALFVVQSKKEEIREEDLKDSLHLAGFSSSFDSGRNNYYLSRT